jgi:hypothetical protein
MVRPKSSAHCRALSFNITLNTEISGYHGGEDIDVGLLDCGVIFSPENEDSTP